MQDFTSYFVEYWVSTVEKNRYNKLEVMIMKHMLLIAGGGTLGIYAARELLEQGCRVDIVCLEEHTSDDPNLRFFVQRITEESLPEFLEGRHYDGIINFIHYKDHREFIRVYPLLMAHTEHLIFLSSYRTYADEQHPITESAPRLLDVVKDPEFLEREDYALPKARCEDFLRSQCAGQNWTIVRPVISFSSLRLDMFMYSGKIIPTRAAAGEKVFMPSYAKRLTAGLDWAGNSGRLIARLLLNADTCGKTYTISTGQNLTWGQVADIYTELTGVEFEWTDEEAFLQACPMTTNRRQWAYIYDRKFDRAVDATAVLEATGFTKEDVTPIAEGIRIELENIGFRKNA